MTQPDTLIDKINRLGPSALAKLSDYVDFLVWQEQTAARRANQVDWTFDFIENFASAGKMPREDARGGEIKIGLAASDGFERPAIFAHPPVEGRSIIEFFVPIPKEVENLHLRFAIGIRDGSKLRGSNLVAFSVRLNGYRIWGTQTNLRRWQPYELDLTTPSGDVSQIAFITEALGDHQWTWAAWAQPILVGNLAAP